MPTDAPTGFNWNETIPIISLWMPWANWVMLGWKTTETRLHRRLAGLAQRYIGIHATQKWDESAIDAARPYLTEEQLWETSTFLRIGGVILGTVYARCHGQLTDADSRSALIDCGTMQRFGLTLEQPTLIEAIPARGKQGIWYYRGEK